MGTFDVRTGAPTGRPCVVPIKSYPVTIIDGQIHVDVD
jgi:p-cumate 2,3-dioxygenase ferredoxin subunit